MFRTKLGKIFLGGLIVVAMAGFFVRNDHAAFWWDTLPGGSALFNALYGFLATFLIVFLSKWVGHLFLMKPEDYYK